MRGRQRMGFRRGLMIVAAIALLMAVLVPASSAQDQMTVPTTIGQTVTVTWQGTVLPGANPTSECGATDVGASTEDVAISVPAGTYSSVAVQGTAGIAFSGNNDMIVTVVFPDGKTVSADSGSFGEGETASFSNPPAGTLHIITCMFAGATTQAYTGTLTLKATAIPAPTAAPTTCDAPGKALTFSTPAYVDTTRAGGEPSVFSLPNGTLLYAAHAGTTHFYSPYAVDTTSTAFIENYKGQVHAWVSDDHGATWNFVDRSLPPDNLDMSGFSDPDFAIDASGNVYLSEINLVNVAVSKSSTSGHSYTLQNLFAMSLTDRQWTAAAATNMLFIVGNPSGGGTVPTDPVGHTSHTIYRSIDGGKTFSAGVTDGGGLGDLVFDPVSKTLYEAHISGGKLQIAAFRKALDPVAQVALTPEVSDIASGVSELSHWPAIDTDSKGNVYITWDESGNGTRAAGIYYSYSTTGGRTWAAPTRVDPDNRTDIWPWIAVGDPGRVAVAWFGNDHALPGNDAEAAGEDDPWNVYVAQTQNGLGCTDSTSPGFKTSRATPEPFHVGTVCMGGTTCQAFLIDRRLGDYFTIDIDTTGALVAAYSDTREGGAVSLPAFFRQIGGTSFSRGKPQGKKG
jgi:hypothetical protein